MKPSSVLDIDGEVFPDPLTIDYQYVVDNTNRLPPAYTISFPDLHKLWVKYYKETGKTEMDDILYSVNGIGHVGMLEPEDNIYLFNTDLIRSFDFKDLPEN